MKPIIFLLTGLIIILLTLFFLPFLNWNEIPYAGDFTGSDLTELNLPFRFFVSQSLRQGQLPLWTDLLANGFPLLAEGQAGVFYPFNLIFYSFLPFVAAVNLSFLLNFILAGIFTYFYSRVLKISRAGSLLAALAFTLSGFFIFRLKHLNIINAAIWLPLGFYLIEKYFSVKKKRLIIISLSLVFAIQFFAGHPQISYISILISFIYFSLRFYQLRGKEKRKELILKIVLIWIFIGILTFGLTAIQFLPTYELSQNSYRSDWMNYKNSMIDPYKLAYLFNFLYPYTFGNPAAGNYFYPGAFWENNIYFGFLPLILAGYALITLWRKKPIVKNFLILLAISFFFVFAKYNPLFELFWWLIPGFKMFRFHQRFLLPVLLVLATSAGIGLDSLLAKLSPASQKKVKFEKSKLFLRVFSILIILITVADLFFFSHQYIGSISASYFEEPKSVQFLKQDKETFRIFSYNWQKSWPQTYSLSKGWQGDLDLYLEHRQLIQPNLNLFYGLPAMDDRGWREGGQLSRRLSKLWISNLDSQIFDDEENQTTQFSSHFLKIWGMQNVKYFLSFHELVGEGLELKKEIKQNFLSTLKIYENKHFLPRAFAVFNLTVISDEKEIIEELLDENFDPRQNIIIEKPIVYENVSHLSSGQVKIVNLSPQEIEINVDFSTPGFLFLGQTYYPGWQVLVDGIRQEILRANYAFSAVEINAGKHKVKFYYQPKSFLIGRNITISTLALIIIFFLNHLYFLKRKGHDKL